jgi:hypothetical protein
MRKSAGLTRFTLAETYKDKINGGTTTIKYKSNMLLENNIHTTDWLTGENRFLIYTVHDVFAHDTGIECHAPTRRNLIPASGATLYRFDQNAQTKTNSTGHGKS